MGKQKVHLIYILFSVIIFYGSSDCDQNDPRTLVRDECQPSAFPTIGITSKPTIKSRNSITDTSKSSNLRNTRFRLSSGYDFSESSRYVLKASDGTEYNHYGFSLGMGKHLAVIGSYQDKNSGSVYVYTLEHPEVDEGENDVLEWKERTKLIPQDIKEDDDFGYAIAVNDRTIYVGSYRADRDKDKSHTGAVYVFSENDLGSFEQQHKLTSFKPQANEFFGYAISSQGKFTAVSAYGNSDKGQNCGIVYIFIQEENTIYYGNNAKIYPSDAQPNLIFGSSVSLSYPRVLVGAEGDATQGAAAGSAYVYTYFEESNSWENEWKLMGEDTNAYDYFGCSLTLNGDVAVVGAYLADGVASTTGVVYIFHRYEVTSNGETKDYWRQVCKLTPDNGHPNSFFGHSVFVSNDLILIGAPGDGTIASSSGLAYAYERGDDESDWQLTLLIESPSKMSDDRFGCAVSLYENVALIGADMANGMASNTGLAYIYTPLSDYSDSLTIQNQVFSSSSILTKALNYISNISGEYILLTFILVTFLFSMLVATLIRRNQNLRKERALMSLSSPSRVQESDIRSPLPTYSRHSRFDGEVDPGTALDISNVSNFNNGKYLASSSVSSNYIPENDHTPVISSSSSYPIPLTTFPHRNSYPLGRSSNFDEISPRLPMPSAPVPRNTSLQTSAQQSTDSNYLLPSDLDISNVSLSALSWSPNIDDSVNLHPRRSLSHFPMKSKFNNFV